MKLFAQFLKRVIIVAAVLALVLAGSLFYTFKIEPYRIEVNEYTLNQTPGDHHMITVAQLSDLHIKEDFTHENLAKVVERVNDLHPDFVILSGDLYDNYASYRDNENVIAQLQKIDAAYEKIAVWGNRDYGGGAVRQFASIMEQSGFRLLKNQNLSVTLDSIEKTILFTGLDDALMGHPALPDDMVDADYRALLSHEPDVVDAFWSENYDLVLSGHSHGGQVNIPFFPEIHQWAVSKTELAQKYSAKMYPLSEHASLYVNTGIGTTHFSARLGVVPEIAVFRIYL